MIDSLSWMMLPVRASPAAIARPNITALQRQIWNSNGCALKLWGHTGVTNYVVWHQDPIDWLFQGPNSS